MAKSLVLPSVLPALALLALAASARAGTVLVDCRTDPDGLQAAIDAALPGDTLIVRGACHGNFVVPKDLRLQGIGYAPRLDGQGGGTVLRVDAGATVELRDLGVTNGASGIVNEGELRILRCRIYANGQGPASASGIENRAAGELALIDSRVVLNESRSGSGAILNQNDACMEIHRTQIHHNSGGTAGGIYNQNDATLELRLVSVLGNTGTIAGGMYNQNDAVTDARDVTIAWNRGQRAGGVYNQNEGRFTLHRGDVSWNTATADSGSSAGGIYNQNDGSIDLRATTVSHNTGGDATVPGEAAGGILNRNRARALLDGTTVTGNWAGANGIGGLSHVGNLAGTEVRLLRSAVFLNHGGLGGGVFGKELPLQLVVSIVTANLPDDCSGFIDGQVCL